MTLIIKELVVKSTIIDKKTKASGQEQKQMKEEIIRACTNRLMRYFKDKNER